MAALFFDHLGIEISPGDLKSPSAVKMCQLILSERLDDVEFVQCLTNNARSLEALVLNVHVALGQKKTTNNIHSVEPIAITFAIEASLPAVYPLRDDFPFDLPHVNVAGSGVPRSLCLSNQPHEDQLRGYTAAKFLCQIQWWLQETAYGKLHGEEQPLDPMFFLSATNIIASDELDEAEYIVGYCPSPHEISPIVFAPLTEEQYSKRIGAQGLLTPIFINTDPVPHGQLNYLPNNFLELIQVYAALGADILPKISEALKSLIARKYKDALLDQPTILIIETEIKGPDGRSRIQRKAYLTSVTTSKIASSLGFLAKEGGSWAWLITPQVQDDQLIEQIDVESADLHPHFSRDAAALYSGYESVDERRIVLLGAGAVGSHFSMVLVRGGIGIWDIIDDDFVLPHNQARYALDPNNLGSAKADALTLVIQRLLEDRDAAMSHVAKLKPMGNSKEVKEALTKADVVIDATASVLAARNLAFNGSITAPVFSAFMNPAGSDAVLLSEASDRSLKIDCVEMHYYWAISESQDLEGHLLESGKPLPIGGCRSPSARIPETQVSLLSSLMAGYWLKNSERKTANISIWRGAAEFAQISYFSTEVPGFYEIEIGEWAVKVSGQIIADTKRLRQKFSPKETGGIVAGSWDRYRKVIYLVGIYDAPPNSKHSVVGFERGSVGVFKSIHDLEKTTLGNLTYVGEWHSHPPGVAANPSQDDRHLIKWIGDVLEAAEAPATMLIAGEDGLRVILRENGEEHEAIIPE